MGTLKDRLNEDLRTAMKGRDELTLSTLRMALAAVRNAEVQLKDRQVAVGVRVTDGAEREHLWRDVVLVQAPWRAKFAQRSGRVIPVAVLTPQDPDT